MQTLMLSRSGQPAAVAPLATFAEGPLRRAELAGVRHLFEPMDLLYRTPDDAFALARALRRLDAAFLLTRVPAESPTVAAMQAAFGGRGRTIVRPVAGCPVIHLDRSWIVPEQHLNSGRRSDFRRFQRKAAQFGDVRYDLITPKPADVPTLLDTAFQIENRSWKGQTGTSLLREPERAAFYQDYALRAAREGTLRIAFLHLGETAVAMQIALENPRGFWLLKIGYDEAYAPCSPGNLLLRETIKYAAEQRLPAYEFLGRIEKWTQVWTPTERALVSIRAYPLLPHALLTLAYDLGREAQRRWQEHKETGDAARSA